MVLKLHGLSGALFLIWATVYLKRFESDEALLYIPPLVGFCLVMAGALLHARLRGVRFADGGRFDSRGRPRVSGPAMALLLFIVFWMIVAGLVPVIGLRTLSGPGFPEAVVDIISVAWIWFVPALSLGHLLLRPLAACLGLLDKE